MLFVLAVASGIGRLEALALLVLGVSALMLSEVIRRRGTVAEVYGGARAAPYYRVLMLLFGLFWLCIGIWRLISPSA